jgi:hypothetical protein
MSSHVLVCWGSRFCLFLQCIDSILELFRQCGSFICVVCPFIYRFWLPLILTTPDSDYAWFWLPLILTTPDSDYFWFRLPMILTTPDFDYPYDIICKWKDRQHKWPKGQQDTRCSTKHYTENYKSISTNTTKKSTRLNKDLYFIHRWKPFAWAYHFTKRGLWVIYLV